MKYSPIYTSHKSLIYQIRYAAKVNKSLHLSVCVLSVKSNHTAHKIINCAKRTEVTVRKAIILLSEFTLSPFSVTSH